MISIPQKLTFGLLMSFISAMMISCEFLHVDKSSPVIIVQPLGSFDYYQSKKLVENLKTYNSEIFLSKIVPLPRNAYVTERRRYRADSLLRLLRNWHGSDTITVGITNSDISTGKGKINDWGIMGLGYRPGKACVVSTFRLSNEKRNEQFYKVVLHEIGHTFGLPHCTQLNCFMRDAEGGNPLDQEVDFCIKCKNFLRSKGFSKSTPSDQRTK